MWTGLVDWLICYNKYIGNLFLKQWPGSTDISMKSIPTSTYLPSYEPAKFSLENYISQRLIVFLRD